MGARILVVDDSATIRKVVSAILTARSYEPVLAEDGQAALEMLGQEPVDLILLDFVMPRMNGYQFCRALRGLPEHKHLPIVLMSAKGDKIRGKFVKQTGAADAITKPFDARGLIAVIEGALQRHEEGRTRPVPEADAMPEEESLRDTILPGAPLASDPGIGRSFAVRELGLQMARLITPDLAKMSGFPRAELDRLPELFSRMLVPDVLASLNMAVRAALPADQNRDVLSGDISVISIAEVLQLLYLQRQTGALTIATRSSREVTLYIREGNIDLASWRGLGQEFFIGRYLVEQGAFGRDRLSTVLERALDRKQLIGESVVELELTGEDEIRRALVRQTSELVYEVVRWKEGRFRFSAGTRSAAAEKANLGLTTGALVMEGFRRVDEWRLIEGSFDFDEVLTRDQVAIDRIGDEAKLTTQERRVLELIDGQLSVSQIVDQISGSSFEVCKILYQFLNSRLVRRAAA
ncbi:MAG TPA: response regulator [Polyangiaceae bacterium]